MFSYSAVLQIAKDASAENDSSPYYMMSSLRTQISCDVVGYRELVFGGGGLVTEMVASNRGLLIKVLS